MSDRSFNFDVEIEDPTRRISDTADVVDSLSNSMGLAVVGESEILPLSPPGRRSCSFERSYEEDFDSSAEELDTKTLPTWTRRTIECLVLKLVKGEDQRSWMHEDAARKRWNSATWHDVLLEWPKKPKACVRTGSMRVFQNVVDRFFVAFG